MSSNLTQSSITSAVLAKTSGEQLTWNNQTETWANSNSTWVTQDQQRTAVTKNNVTLTAVTKS